MAQSAQSIFNSGSNSAPMDPRFMESMRGNLSPEIQQIALQAREAAKLLQQDEKEVVSEVVGSVMEGQQMQAVEPQMLELVQVTAPRGQMDAVTQAMQALTGILPEMEQDALKASLTARAQQAELEAARAAAKASEAQLTESAIAEAKRGRDVALEAFSQTGGADARAQLVEQFQLAQQQRKEAQDYLANPGQDLMSVVRFAIGGAKFMKGKLARANQAERAALEDLTELDAVTQAVAKSPYFKSDAEIEAEVRNKLALEKPGQVAQTMQQFGVGARNLDAANTELRQIATTRAQAKESEAAAKQRAAAQEKPLKPSEQLREEKAIDEIQTVAQISQAFQVPTAQARELFAQNPLLMQQLQKSVAGTISSDEGYALLDPNSKALPANRQVVQMVRNNAMFGQEGYRIADYAARAAREKPERGGNSTAITYSPQQLGSEYVEKEVMQPDAEGKMIPVKLRVPVVAMEMPGGGIGSPNEFASAKLTNLIAQDPATLQQLVGTQVETSPKLDLFFSKLAAQKDVKKSALDWKDYFAVMKASGMTEAELFGVLYLAREGVRQQMPTFGIVDVQPEIELNNPRIEVDAFGGQTVVNKMRPVRSPQDLQNMQIDELTETRARKLFGIIGKAMMGQAGLQ